MKKTKFCSKCGKEKRRNDFYKNINRKDGLSPWCKECRRMAGKKYHKGRAPQ